MKANRLLFELALILVIAGLLVWKFWPKKAGSDTHTTATTQTASVQITKAAVAAPTSLPVVSSSGPAGSLTVNGSTLYDATKARDAAPGTAGNGDVDFNNILKGSPELAKLDKQMAEDAALTQALTLPNPATMPPVVVTDLGDVALAQDQPEKRTLATGDEVTFTLQTGDKAPLHFKGWYVRYVIVHPGPDGEASVLGASGVPVLQPGQPAVIKATPKSGNEIHFVPELAGSASAK